MLLFETLNGEPPFSGTHAEVFRQHLSGPPDLSLLLRGTPSPLRELIERCLEKEAAGRPSVDICLLLLAQAAGDLEQTADTGPSTVTGPPRRFDRWVVRQADPEAPFSYRCSDPATGEDAVGEVHFSDDVALGERLRAAVEANPRLVPLGAERFLGTSRVVLRPDEAWERQPPRRFAFWLARAVSPVEPPGEPLAVGRLRLAASGLMALRDAVRAAGLPFEPAAEDIAFDGELQPQLRRPGVPRAGTIAGEGAPLAALAALPLTDEARRLLEQAADLDAVVAVQPAAARMPAWSARWRRPSRAVLLSAGALAVAATVSLVAAAFVLTGGTEPESSDVEDIASLGGGAARTGLQPGPGPSSKPIVQWLHQTGGAVRTTVAVDDDTVYLAVGDALVALDNEGGAERWRFEAGAAVAVPAASADGLVYVGDAAGLVYALDADDGAERWRFDAGAPVGSSPAIVGGTLYVGGDSGHVFALDAATGEQRWRLRTAGPVRSPPSVDAGVVYAGSDDGALYALEASSGEVRWRFAMGGARSPARRRPPMAGCT